MSLTTLNDNLVHKTSQDTPLVNSGARESGSKRSSRVPLVKKLSKHSRELKAYRNYVHYMRYYFSERSPEYCSLDSEAIEARLGRLEHCQHTWHLEHKAGAARFRGVGCGDRHFDILCSSYYQLILSREASRAMLGAIERLKLRGLKFKSLGNRCVLTLPKTESERIDRLLFTDRADEWADEVAKLFVLARRLLSERFPGMSFLLGLDVTGESAPTEPHYHINAYLFPATLEASGEVVEAIPARNAYFNKKGELKLSRRGFDTEGRENESLPDKRLKKPDFKAVVNSFVRSEVAEYYLPRTQAEAEAKAVADGEPVGLSLEALRNAWRDILNEAYGLELAEADVNYGYLRSSAQVYHWLRYLYRPLLSDIWRGWQAYDVEAGVLTYSYKNEAKKRFELEITREDLSRSFERLDLIPRHFKRIRWYGAFSDGKRGKTMMALGMVRKDLAEFDDGDSEAWQVKAQYKFVRSTSSGMILDKQERNADGLYVSTGQLLEVSDKRLTYAPKGVKLGRRAVWLSPGGARASKF